MKKELKKLLKMQAGDKQEMENVKNGLRVMEYRMKKPVICLTEVPVGHYITARL